MTQPTLQFRPDGKFTILQVSDPQDMHFVRRAMLRMLDTAYDLVRPDFVLFTGDNILGNHLTDARFGDRRDAWDKETILKRMRKAIGYIAEPVEKRGIPFGAVYGNHDDMNEIPRREHSEIYRGYSQFVGLNQTDPAVSEDTCLLPIRSSDGSRVAFHIWTMDSTGHNDDGSEEYNYVPKADIDWYVRTSEQAQADNGGEKIPSLMFQHITVPEIEELVEETTADADGAVPRRRDGTYYRLKPDMAAGLFAGWAHGYRENYGQFDAVVDRGDVLAIVGGHDHLNGFRGTLRGVDLIQTTCASFRCFGECQGKNARGVRVFELEENDPWHFETYTLYFNDLMGDGLSAKLQYFWDADEMEAAKSKTLKIAGAVGAAAVAGIAAAIALKAKKK